MASNSILIDHCEKCAFICSDRQQKEPARCPRRTYHPGPLHIARIRAATIGPLFGEHWHEQLQLLYFRQGAVRIRCGGTELDLQAGDLLVINSNDIHYGNNLSGATLYYIFKIDFQDLLSRQQIPEQMQYISLLLENKVRFCNKITKDSTLTALLDQILLECEQQDEGYELAIQAAITNILVRLLRAHRQSTGSTGASNAHSLSQLRIVLAYIDQHSEENLSLKSLASLANMSAQHFCRCFRQLTGRRPMDYINMIRITKAAALLADGRLNISEIAAAVGFSDANYFSRVFKKQQQVSPSEFQQRCQTGRCTL